MTPLAEDVPSETGEESAARAKTPRRILVLNERDPEHPKAGGAETHVERIFSRLAKRGHHVAHYAAAWPGAEPHAIRAGIHLERRGPLPAYYAALPFRLREANRKNEFDLVVDCLNKVPFYSPILSKAPVLALCHHLFGSVAFDQVAWPIAAGVVAAEAGLSRAYRQTRFLAISESSRDDLVSRGIPRDQIRVSHPGIDRPRITVNPEAARPARATYVGRLETYKRVDLLLEASAQLVDRFPDLELVIIGKGPARESLERHAERLGLAHRTRFTGFIEDAERDALLAGTRVCAFPSEKEGWGLTVIEANALGTPVVARNAPGLRDSIRHEETGLLVDLEGVSASAAAKAFAQAMARMLSEGEEAHRFRLAAFHWAKHFDWDRAAQDMEEAIEEAILHPVVSPP